MVSIYMKAVFFLCSKGKMSLKEDIGPVKVKAMHAQTVNTEVQQEVSNIASICQNFVYKRPSSKKRAMSSLSKDDGAFSEFVWGKIQAPNKGMHAKESSNQGENSDMVTESDIKLGGRTTMLRLADGIRVENDVLLVGEENMKAPTDEPVKEDSAKEHDKKMENTEGKCHKKQGMSINVKERKACVELESPLTSTDKRKFTESGLDRKLRPSKRAKRVKGIASKDFHVDSNDGNVGKSKFVATSTAQRKDAIAIDDNEEACLENSRSYFIHVTSRYFLFCLHVCRCVDDILVRACVYCAEGSELEAC